MNKMLTIPIAVALVSFAACNLVAQQPEDELIVEETTLVNECEDIHIEEEIIVTPSK
jgi:hypothetical protein